MVIANESTTELPVPVLEGPHWRVALHPGEHGTERILSNDACWGVMWRARGRLASAGVSNFGLSR